jgi:hypothetical protein
VAADFWHQSNFWTKELAPGAPFLEKYAKALPKAQTELEKGNHVQRRKYRTFHSESGTHFLRGSNKTS